MDFNTYRDKQERLDRLELTIKSLDDEFREYKPKFIELLNQFREIYDISLIESGQYPTF